MFKLEKVTDNIFHFIFKDRVALAHTFLRFQEYYESPEFAGKVFTREEFKKWYRGQRGKFSYYSDWAGFNVPGHIFDAFAVLFKYQTKGERAVLKALKGAKAPYYVIGTVSDDIETMMHEMAHALFYTNPEYRRKVLMALGRQGNTLSGLYEYLRKDGYAEHVLKDEANAYITCDWEYLKDKGIEVPQKCRRALRRLLLNTS